MSYDGDFMEQEEFGLRAGLVEVLEIWVCPKPTMMATLRGGPQITTRRISGGKAQEVLGQWGEISGSALNMVSAAVSGLGVEGQSSPDMVVPGAEG